MTTTTREITNSDDVIDVREITERVEALETELESEHSDDELDEVLDQKAELATLTELLEDLSGNGGDHDWRSDWYPLTLVRESYFEDFAREEAESLDLIKSDARWPYTCIDWKRAARELLMDYTSTDFDGVTYYYR